MPIAERLSLTRWYVILQGECNMIFLKISSLVPMRYLSSKAVTTPRVVVTGMGIVSPLGTGVHHVWKRVLNGDVAASSLTGLEYNSIPCKVAAFVPRGNQENQFDIDKEFTKTEMKTFSMASAFGLVAAKEALADAEWLPRIQEDCKITGVAVGTGMVDLCEIVNTGNLLTEEGYGKISPYFVPRILANMTAGHISIKYGFKGPNHAVSTACTTGLHAIGDAYSFIKLGHASVMVCGGTEAAISPLSIAGFSRMRALSTRYNSEPTKASRPFDKGRDGFVMGEGAGILVLESLEHALQRKAKIYAEVLGYGLSADAHHIATPDTEGNGAFMCMISALKECAVNPAHVGYINAHATSTPLGDKSELTAIHRLFGHPAHLAVSSTKGATGHLLGAAGSVEAIFAVLACHTGQIPPTANLENSDCETVISLVGKNMKPWSKESIPERRIALSNSFGFGGTNASVVFASMEESFTE